MTETAAAGGTMRIRTTVVAGLITVLVAAAAVVGCGGGGGGSSAPATPTTSGTPDVSPAGDIPDNQAFVAYAPAGAGFSVKVPEGWSRSGTGSTTTFTDKLNAIRVQSVSAGAPLTVSEARRAELPKLASSVRGYQPGRVSAVTRRAGTAIRMTYLAAAPRNAVTGKAGTDAVERYVFFHKGREIVLTLSGPKGADNVDPWRIVTESVRWTS
jgi:hypothetical protein